MEPITLEKRFKMMVESLSFEQQKSFGKKGDKHPDCKALSQYFIQCIQKALPD
ncbi:MAG: hypothetical protein U9R50_02815 [Campylobacterota bacterium]|nr:hypothetical protein [Campylobacterota bacterium]